MRAPSNKDEEKVRSRLRLVSRTLVWSAGIHSSPQLTGELKINTNDEDARVYVDGGYLGVARNLKKFDLWLGNYEIELRDARGNVLFKQKVSIVPGRTTEFDAMGIVG
jgi:hypothetical protein